MTARNVWRIDSDGSAVRTTVHMRTEEKRCTDFDGAVESVLFAALMVLPYIAAGIVEGL